MVAGVSLAEGGGGGHALPVPALTPERAVETVRFMVDGDIASAMNPHGAVSLSPDGRWWVARLVSGDVASNGVWMEMRAGERGSLTQALNVRSVARLFTRGLGAGGGRVGANQDTISATSRLRWLDNESVALLWSDANGHRQVLRLNVRSAELHALTAHPTSLLNFDVAADGTVMYSAMAPEAPSELARLLREGFVIEPTTDALSILEGQVNSGSHIDRLWRTQWFVQRRGDSEPRAVAIARRPFSPNQLERVWLSAQGRWAVVNAVAPVVPAEWSDYQDPELARRVQFARSDPYRMLGRLVHQLWVVDTDTGSSHALWSVPMDSDTPQCAWSPAADEILIAPTFLPSKEWEASAQSGGAAAIVERASGRYAVLPIDLKGLHVTDVRWLGAHRVALQVGPRGQPGLVEFQREGDGWRRVDPAAPAATGVRLELREGLDTPPLLVAVEGVDPHAVTVIDPNPQLKTRFDLGRAERIEGTVDDTVRWEGLLFLPPNYDRRRRYPLVIQSVYGSAIADEFTLYGYLQGYGLGPSLIPPYPGRLLAQHDVLVLQLNIAGDTGSGTPSEAHHRARAFEQAARQLIDAGRVDALRVGLIGFSRNGFYVEYALAHSGFPYAAAIAADHWQSDYVTQTLLGYGDSASGVNGGAPFGPTLSAWLKTTPAFNAERIRTPLLQIEQSSGLVGVVLRWELFERLRTLGKPVELWVIPNASLGVHNTQNPEQLIAIQSRVIEWFRFWLSDEEVRERSKRAQYQRWRRLRELQSRVGG